MTALVMTPARPAPWEAQKGTEGSREGEGALVVPRKQHDLREFWRWYERSTNIGEGFPATTPPVTDIDGEPAGPPPKSLRVFVILVGVGVIVFLVWGFLH